MRGYRRSNYSSRRSSYRRSSRSTGGISMALLCGLVGYCIGVKYPEGFYKVQNIVQRKIGHTKGFSGFDIKKKFLPSAKNEQRQAVEKNEFDITNDEVKVDNKNFVSSKSISISANSFQVRFSPHGGCLEFAKSFIDNARNYILVQGYSFTSELLAKALVEAHRRGVKVAILLDKSQPTAVGSQIYFVKNAGIPVSIDYMPGIAHNKIMIIDDKIVLTGSFNWTLGAETRNAENLLMINNEEVAKIYKDNWFFRANKAIKFLENNRASYDKNERFYKKGKISARPAEYTVIE